LSRHLKKEKKLEIKANRIIKFISLLDFTPLHHVTWKI